MSAQIACFGAARAALGARAARDKSASTTNARFMGFPPCVIEATPRRPRRSRSRGHGFIAERKRLTRNIVLHKPLQEENGPHGAIPMDPPPIPGKLEMAPS